MTIRRLLITHEGRRNKPYIDTTGKLTVGVGHNLTDVPLRDEVIDLMLDLDIAGARSDLVQNLSWFDRLDDVRQAALIDMCFNLGWPRLSGFHRMLEQMERGEWVAAANEALDSIWATQVGKRAVNIARMISTGQWPEWM